MTQAPRALFLTGDEVGSTMWRAWSVCRALQDRGFVAEWVPINGCPKCGMESRPEELRQSNAPWTCRRCHHVSRASEAVDTVLPLVAAGAFDLVITPRIVWPQQGIGERWVAAIHRAGLAWVYECDDDVWSAPIVGRQSQLFAREAAKGVEQLEWERQERIRLLSVADGVTVTNTRLKSVVERFTGDRVPVMVVPNAIDVAWFRRVLRGVGRLPELESKLTIGWAGGTRQDTDIAPLVEAWPRIARRFPDVHFVVQGHLPVPLVEAMPPAQLHTLPWLPLEEYPRAMVNVDIGCCVVAPTVFNTAKTPIKWWEFTLAGAACVVSPTLYGPGVVHGYDALVAETVDEWEAALERLVVDPDYRHALCRNARRTVVTEHRLQRNLVNWLDAWSSILETFRARRAAQPKIWVPA